MKQKATISLTMALLMVASVFAIGAAGLSTTDENCGSVGIAESTETYPFGEVVKEVFDGEDWVDSVEAGIGDTLRFRINVTYQKTDHPNATFVKHISIVDTLPDCLEYADSAVPEETEVNGKMINWTWPAEDKLYDGQFIVIEFNATVVDYTDCEGQDNVVEAFGLEKCSSRDLYGTDLATVIVEEEPCEPELVVEKQVWNGTGWDDEIEDLELGDIVTFKITLTYNDCEPGETIVCLEVRDYLPCCLDYADNLDYSESNFAFPELIPDVVGKTIYWNWTGTDTIQMNGGDQMVIIFETEFVNYCDCETVNSVSAYAWTCCNEFSGQDSVLVDCEAPDTTFDKKVKDGEEWVDEIETYTGSTLTFKLELQYYGLATLDFIKFVDELPCILEYVEGSFESDVDNVTVELSADGKTIFFNVSDAVELEQGDSIFLTFSAIVTGCTECGCECDYEAFNYAYVTAGCGPEPSFFMEDELQVTSYGNCPPTIPLISGPHAGQVDEELEFSFISEDPDGNQIYYADTALGETADGPWYGPYDSGVARTVTYIFDSPGTYYIKANAKDEHGAESGSTPEGYGFEVVITEPDEEGVSISVCKLCFGRVGATITNDMEDALTDVDWEISLTGGLLGKVNISANGIIADLPSEGSESIYSSGMMGAGSVKFTNFGKVTGEVIVYADGETYTKEFGGFALGKLVLITS